MSTLIIILFWISLFHFVYEGVIAPSLRSHLRCKLFKVRDDVRAMRISGVRPEDQEALHFVHEGANSLLDRLPSLSVFGHAAAKRSYLQDPKLRSQVQRRGTTIDATSDPRIKKAWADAVLIVWEALLVNAGSWMIYVIPLVILLATIGKLKRLAAWMLCMPEREQSRFLERPVASIAR